MERAKFVRIGNRLVEVDHYENGVPVLKSWSEEITRPDGTRDVKVHVSCLTIKGEEG